MAYCPFQIVDYKGDRSLEELLKFVSKYAKPPTPAAEEEEKPDTPEDVDEVRSSLAIDSSDITSSSSRLLRHN